MCMRLAASFGLPVAQVEYMIVGSPVLVVGRYDRIVTREGVVERIHQEDFCQALGMMPDLKYQADGGPSFADVARIVREACASPLEDIEALVRIALFNLLVGNCDAHGKNFSLLYRGSRTALAPFYDLVSTMAYPELAPKLSMRVGREYRIDKIGKAELEQFARDIGVRPRLVSDSLRELIHAAPPAWIQASELPEIKAYAELIARMRGGWDERARRALAE